MSPHACTEDQLVEQNPGLPTEANQTAIDELACDRSALSQEAANREVYRLLRGQINLQAFSANCSLAAADGQRHWDSRDWSIWLKVGRKDSGRSETAKARQSMNPDLEKSRPRA
ncbi:MAG: hypothetical protein ACK6EB_18240 [Planctomyces sp.]